jgi:uncharacterized protein YkwD
MRTDSTRRTRTTRTRLITALAAIVALALPTGVSLTATASASSATTKVTKSKAAKVKAAKIKAAKAKAARLKAARLKAARAAKAMVARTTDQQTYENQVIYYVNVQRHLGGLPSVTSAACPENTSARWATNLASTDGFYHQNMYTLLDKCDAHYAGETLGRGEISPETLVTMWMNSPPHHAVLMSPTPDRIGVGAVKNASGEWVTAANFIKF